MVCAYGRAKVVTYVHGIEKHGSVNAVSYAPNNFIDDRGYRLIYGEELVLRPKVSHIRTPRYSETKIWMISMKCTLCQPAEKIYPGEQLK